MTVEDLDAIRSTWSATDQGSRKDLSPWPPLPYPAVTSPEELKRLLFLPNQEAILSQVAQPRKGLFEKTVDEYRSPQPPVAVGWAVDRVITAQWRSYFQTTGK